MGTLHGQANIAFMHLTPAQVAEIKRQAADRAISYEEMLQLYLADERHQREGRFIEAGHRAEADYQRLTKNLVAPPEVKHVRYGAHESNLGAIKARLRQEVLDELEAEGKITKLPPPDRAA